jgi:transposase InsO family protein
LWGQRRIQAERFEQRLYTPALPAGVAHHEENIKRSKEDRLRAYEVASPSTCVGRQVLHIQVTEHPTAMWAAQQIVECCGWDHKPPRFLIHDRDSRYGELFDRRLQGLGITQIRTPFRAPRANSIAERWVRSARHECLDHIFIFSERHLRRVLAEYVAYFNQWRPHRSIGQRAPCAPPVTTPGRQSGTVMATPVLGGLHHVYQIAA